MTISPPLRFLAVVVGGWICVRAFVLAPGWWAGAGPGAAAPPSRADRPEAPAGAAARAPPRPRPAAGSGNALAAAAPARREPAAAPANSPAPAMRGEGAGAAPPPPGLMPMPEPARIGGAGRWSGAAWILARPDRGGPSLAAGGTLGGSQAGARILYRLNADPARPLALSARVEAPLRRIAGAEAALGLDWRPAARLPVHLLAERRQALASGGRSTFSLSLYGGGSRALARGLRFEAFGQAGIVGLRSRDAFIDGSARISAPIGPLEIGGGAWGGAQPGAARLDVGPLLSYRLPIAGANLRLQADWRLRVAGGAAPGSGPALTLAADF